MKRNTPPVDPLIQYPGGQSKLARKLAKHIPEHSTYVEPFAGGASFFFRKTPAEVEVLGDTNEWLIPFYNDVRKGKLKPCKAGIKYDPKVLKRAVGKKDACSRMTISALGFGGFLSGSRGNFNYRGLKTGKKIGDIVYDSKMKRLPVYEARLRHAHLIRDSFDKTMKRFDGPDTFHLLDPPWPDDKGEGSKRSNRYYNTYRGEDKDFSSLTPDSVASVVKKMKGKVWVLYNKNPEVVRAFQGLHIYRVPMTKMHAGKGLQKDERLLISNYPLNKGERRKKSDR